MDEMKKISVIIPNYNYARYLDQAIQSVLEQTYKNLELIVVNNGSTDNSLQVLSKYVRLIHIIDQPNLGQSGARNSGLSFSSGEYIAFLDADDFWEPKKLEKQIMLLNDTCQLVYCGISPFKDPGNEKLPSVFPKYRGKCSTHFVDQPGASIVLSGESTALFSRDLLFKAGSFDGELNSTAGWDFFRRCSLFTNFDFVSEPLVNYRLHSFNMSNSSDKVILDMRRAYSKLFTDKDWSISQKKKLAIRRALEWSFFKTFLRSYEFKSAGVSAIRLLKLISKFD
jgi:glycosyltransferase involved in cell wall biosynthesis